MPVYDTRVLCNVSGQFHGVSCRLNWSWLVSRRLVGWYCVWTSALLMHLFSTALGMSVRRLMALSQKASRLPRRPRTRRTVMTELDGSGGWLLHG